jgi:23S rRNA (cytosine1962-C5)-methyltransferase
MPSARIDKAMNAGFLQRSVEARAHLFDEEHQTALRLFNGFHEGDPTLAIDLYARTLVIHNYADIPAGNETTIRLAQEFLLDRFAWIQTIVVKARNGSAAQKRGVLVYGTTPDARVDEHGIGYAVDLTMNQDASLYLDTRNLRKWALDNLKGRSVLNTFAYTGSLGVAAQAGGASRVIHIDLSRKFLDVAKASYTLNGFPIAENDFVAADFFPAIGHLKRTGAAFDCVFLDPPFFSATVKGRVDLEKDSARLINKVRPLINDGGHLIAINNALFVSGSDYIRSLEALCAGGYLRIESLIPVPEDFTGYPQTKIGQPPVDSAPFNHSTKIAVLKVRRK